MGGISVSAGSLPIEKCGKSSKLMVNRGVFSQQSPHEEAVFVAPEAVAVDVLDHMTDEVP